MHDFSSIATIAGYTLAILSGALAFFYRTRTQAEIDFYERNNAELRSSNSDLRQEKSDCENDARHWKARYDEQAKSVEDLKKLNGKQADFAGIAKLISNNQKVLSDNHKDVMNHLSDLASKLIDNRPTNGR